MEIKWLKFVKKWVLIYHGKAIGAGNTQAEAIEQGITVFRLLKLR